MGLGNIIRSKIRLPANSNFTIKFADFVLVITINNECLVIESNLTPPISQPEHFFTSLQLASPAKQKSPLVCLPKKFINLISEHSSIQCPKS